MSKCMAAATTILLLASVAWAQVTTTTATAPTAPATAPVNGGAQAYMDWLDTCIAQVARQMPEITQSAEAAAKLYVEKGFPPSFTGNPTLASEAYGRSGGLNNISWPGENLAKKDYRGAVVSFFGETKEQVDANLKEIEAAKKQGCLVIAVGTAANRRALKDAKIEVDYFLNSGAVEGGALGKSGDKAILPTEPVAQMVVLWTWTSELVAACTRLGKMPTMWQSIAIPEAVEWNKKTEGKQFHDFEVKPVKAGTLGKGYLDALAKVLKQIRDEEMQDIRKAAAQAVAAREAGHATYTFTHGHAIAHAHGSPYDPQYLKSINQDWTKAQTDVLKKGDFVLTVGYISLYHGKQWGEFDQKARAAGATIAWSFTGYNPDEVKLIADGEVFIDQHWKKGDAEVSIEGYPINICPVSGIVAETILWSVQAEMAAQMASVSKPAE